MKGINIYHYLITILLVSLSSPSLFLSEETMKKPIQTIYWSNKKIVGDYNKDLSIKSNKGIFVGKLKNDVLSFKGIPYT